MKQQHKHDQNNTMRIIKKKLKTDKVMLTQRVDFVPKWN